MKYRLAVFTRINERYFETLWNILHKQQLFEQYSEFVAFHRTGTYNVSLPFVFFLSPRLYTYVRLAHCFWVLFFVFDFLTSRANTKIVTEQYISFFPCFRTWFSVYGTTKECKWGKQTLTVLAWNRANFPPQVAIEYFDSALRGDLEENGSIQSFNQS